MKCFLLGMIILSHLLASSQRHFALVTSDTFDRKLIQEIKIAVYGMYRMDIDSVGKFEVASQNAERSVAVMRYYHMEKEGYIGAVGLTKLGIFEGIDFFPEPLYGLTVGSNCIVSDYILSFPDYPKSKYNPYMIHVVLHEMGHILGLEHCQNSKCIMRCCGHLDNAHLCDHCKKLFSQMKWN